MLFLIVLAILFSVISIYDTKFFYPLLLIFIALFANNAHIIIFNFNVSYGLLYTISMLAILSYKNKNLNLKTFKLYLSSSRATFLIFITGFMFPFLWNFFYFEQFAAQYLINHINAALIVFLFTFLTYKSGTVLMEYFHLYAKIGLSLILLIAPQSLIFFLKTGGLGFGRFRSSQIIEIPHVWTYQLIGDTYLFKTTTHGSYLITFFSSILTSSLVISYFRTAKWEIRTTYICTIFFAFIVTYVNQYISSTLIFVICTFVSAVYCFIITKNKKIVHLIPTILSIFFISIALTPSSEILKKINSFNSSFSLPISKVDLYDQLKIMHNTANESSNRITLIYNSFKNLEHYDLIYTGIGMPYNIDLNSHPKVEASRHALGIDYLVYFGVLIGSIVICLKLFLIFFTTKYFFLKKKLEYSTLFILNGVITLALFFLVGRLDYYSWSLLVILGLWITPFIHNKMSKELAKVH